MAWPAWPRLPPPAMRSRCRPSSPAPTRRTPSGRAGHHPGGGQRRGDRDRRAAGHRVDRAACGAQGAVVWRTLAHPRRRSHAAPPTRRGLRAPRARHRSASGTNRAPAMPRPGCHRLRHRQPAPGRGQRRPQRQRAARCVACWTPGMRAVQENRLDAARPARGGNRRAVRNAARRARRVGIFAPANPAMGRSTRGGRVFVRDQPLEQTETWRREHTYENCRPRRRCWPPPDCMPSNYRSTLVRAPARLAEALACDRARPGSGAGLRRRDTMTTSRASSRAGRRRAGATASCLPAPPAWRRHWRRRLAPRAFRAARAPADDARHADGRRFAGAASRARPRRSSRPCRACAPCA